jgi:hypothetical protein
LAAVVTEAAQPRKTVRPFSIGPVQQVGQRYLNLLIYGAPGAGKTTFAGSALDVPSMNDVLYVNAEGGDMSLTNRPTLDVININKYDTLARIFEYLVRHCRYRDENNIEKLLEEERELKSEVIPVEWQTAPAKEGRTWFEEQRLRSGRAMDDPFRYRTVVLDSISELHKYLVYKYTGVDIGKTKLDDEIEKMEEWQPAQELFRLLIRSFRDLPINSVFVSAEQRLEPDRKKNRMRTQYVPKLAGQMAADVAGFLDIVGYMMKEEAEGGEGFTRVLYLAAGYDGWISKHRFTSLPDLEYILDPTLQSLIDLAKKDAEHGTSEARSSAEAVRNITPIRERTRAAKADSSPAARPTRSATGASRRRRG